jgi:hypothetical protein
MAVNTSTNCGPPGCMMNDRTSGLASHHSAHHDMAALKPPNAPKRPAPAMTILHITELQLASTMPGSL